MIMVKMNIGPIYLSEYTFLYVTDMRNKTKSKNYSEIVNQMLSRHSDLLEQVQALRGKLQEKTKENSDLQETIRKYRDNIINTDYLPKVGDK